MLKKHKIEAKRFYRCKFCYASKSALPELSEHYENTHNHCEECNKTCLSQDELKIHQDEKHARKIKCSMCNFETNMTNVYNAHIRSVLKTL